MFVTWMEGPGKPSMDAGSRGEVGYGRQRSRVREATVGARGGRCRGGAHTAIEEVGAAGGHTVRWVEG